MDNNHKNLLKLSSNLFLKDGATRSVYRHPLDNNKCVKVLKDVKIKDFKSFKKFLRLHLLGFDPNKNELQNYRKISNTGIGKFLPKFDLELVDTNFGKGLVCEVVKDFDGNISKCIHKYINEKQVSDLEIEKQLGEFFAILLKSDVFFYDFNLNNFMIRLKRNNEVIQKQLVYSDIKSLNEAKSLIKVERIFKFLARNKLRRRVRQFYKVMNLRIPVKLKEAL